MPPSPKLLIRPISHNSSCITFPEWISLFTLCLAPLIAHIISGTPPVSHLTRHRPKWHDHFCHYNPTSIIWRYAAITDRRIRALRWSRNDLAASNAVFWTAKGWDGGEDMVETAKSQCLRHPEHTRVKIWSATALKTLVTTLQGVGAVFSLVGTLAGVTNLNFVALMGLDTVFFPLAVLGLLRLCAAVWLAEDFEYVEWDVGITTHKVASIGDAGDFDPFLIVPSDEGPRFKSPNSSWPSWFFRIFYLSAVGGSFGMSIVYVVPYGDYVFEVSTTAFLVGLFYIVFLGVSVVLYAFYFLRGRTTTTLLPCLSRTWYKMYTFMLFSLMLVIVVLASVETTRSPDGRYVSVEPYIKLDCAFRDNWWALVSNKTLSGVISRKNDSIRQAYLGAELTGYGSLKGESYWLYNFTGYCVGQLTNFSTPVAP